jgi:hypothetical protein
MLNDSFSIGPSLYDTCLPADCKKVGLEKPPLKDIFVLHPFSIRSCQLTGRSFCQEEIFSGKLQTVFFRILN